MTSVKKTAPAKEKNNRSISALLPKLALTISTMALTAVLYSRMKQVDFTQMAFGMLCSGVIAFLFIHKCDVLKRLYSVIDKPSMVVAGILSVTTALSNAMYFQQQWTGSGMFATLPYRNIILTAVAVLGGICGLFAVFSAAYAFVRWFRRLAVDFVKESDTCEKVYFISASVLFSLIIALIFSMTNIFYAPTDNGQFIPYDVIFTSDSPFLVKYDTYLNISSIENDLRQPLFGVFAAPFAAVAKTISYLLFFVPNIYVICLGIIQAVLLVISNIMTARLLKLGNTSKSLYFAISSVIFPVLLYSLCLEQYIFAVFWLITFVYLTLHTSEDNRLPFIGATGSLLTTGALFPLLVLRGTFKERIVTLIKTFAAFVSFMIISGEITMFFGISSYFSENLMHFMGEKLSFHDKLLQYINFVTTCFVSPAAEIRTLPDKTFLTYQMGSVDFVNYAGIVIILLAVLGFILNHKNAFARVCAYWAAFSFIMLCIIGWGTAENGLVLYSLYFSWAFLGLLVMLVEKLFARVPIVKYIIYALGIVAILATNIPGMLELIRFGTEVYPA